MKNTTQNIINVSLAIIVTLLIFNVFELKEQVSELDVNPNTEAIEIVKAAYTTFGSGDLEGWKKLHSDDLKFTVLGNIKTSGVHIGKDAVIRDVFNDSSNHDGSKLKLILGSKVMNEGVTLENTKEVHILDVYYNFGRIDQTIGRAIRQCKHYKITSEKNPYPDIND